MAEQFETEINVKSSLKKCLEIAHNHVKALLGAKEVAKNLHRGNQLQLVVMSKDLLQGYQDIIIERCQAMNVPVMYVETREELAEIAPVKVKKFGCAGIIDFVTESREKMFLMNEIK